MYLFLLWVALLEAQHDSRAHRQTHIKIHLRKLHVKQWGQKHYTVQQCPARLPRRRQEQRDNATMGGTAHVSKKLSLSVLMTRRDTFPGPRRFSRDNLERSGQRCAA